MRGHKKLEIVNREVRDATYELVVTDAMYEELKTLSPDELVQFLEQTEKEWNCFDWGMKRINTGRGLNIQNVTMQTQDRRHRYEEIFDAEKCEKIRREKELPDSFYS